jgi:hypothetical protein
MGQSPGVLKSGDSHSLPAGQLVFWPATQKEPIGQSPAVAAPPAQYSPFEHATPVDDDVDVHWYPTAAAQSAQAVLVGLGYCRGQVWQGTAPLSDTWLDAH